MLKIDIVFSGGGMKAFAFLGALKTLEKSRYTIERVAGTSAGAIIASLIAAGYSADEIKQLVETVRLETFMDAPKYSKHIPFLKIISLYFYKGLYKGDIFEH